MSFPVPDYQALEALRILVIAAYVAPFALAALLGLLWWARPRRVR